MSSESKFLTRLIPLDYQSIRVGVGHGPSMYTDVCGSVRGHRGCPLALDAQTYTCVDWHYDIQSWPREEILVLSRMGKLVR